ncbi:hypothetical protein Ahy_A10g048003 [Arachis hypogaea]|uniref:Uncharacterized protein n=1 Tax=Arachis hypogaea TaxID=3818 RepID=A0A445B421_ARAHY|nr:hypothetical protein Ahy_A10g048003 [Arachis hypogaea]
MLRKYLNLKHGEIATYFKRRYKHYERFEIHGWLTNMAVDFGKSICAYRFWQIIAELTHYFTSFSTVLIQLTRPKKLPPKRRPTQPSPATNMDPMQGASSEIAAGLAGVMKFVPTPGFIPPRKK